MLLIIIAFAVVLIDQGTKAIVRAVFESGDSVPLIKGIFHLTYVQNPGAAFGMLPYRQAFFISVTFVIIGAVIFYYKKLPPDKKLLRFALGLAVGGALGNLIDRVRFGHVTDFFDFRIWPVFNVADMAIVAGTILLAWEILNLRQKDRP